MVQEQGPAMEVVFGVYVISTLSNLSEFIKNWKSDYRSTTAVVKSSVWARTKQLASWEHADASRGQNITNMMFSVKLETDT